MSSCDTAVKHLTPCSHVHALECCVGNVCVLCPKSSSTTHTSIHCVSHTASSVLCDQLPPHISPKPIVHFTTEQPWQVATMRIRLQCQHYWCPLCVASCLALVLPLEVQHSTAQSTHKLETTYTVLCRNMCSTANCSHKRSKPTTWHLVNRHD